MAFGQQNGYPATARQIEELALLVAAAGHVDFRAARHPLGFTQRQASGKFTRDEADELIERLSGEAEFAQLVGRHDPDAAVESRQPVDPKVQQQIAQLKKMPVDLLASELQSRGWVVLEP